ncbi:bacterioferritin [Oceanimonas sp. NS1]|uniref:Bacterioferritin n=1 Tax=Oceanimonas doudoroffii TaxID=84158 RepID=A0A233RJA2_9GAMM|nr:MULTISPECIES: bacterioferritin [Oceanimonas]MCT7653802.1 bacterioferritin [Oceanimonas sp. NS1]NHH99925.1 Bacterioferritin [Oceanimonas sp. MB9]OXY83472.1 bacterioferritin [Oceanimonas doudoroffii]
MKGDTKVIEYLNQVLSIELTSINQYFLHARMFKNWGLQQLNDREYKKSIKDMKQADDLIERILFLEGLPNLQHLNRLRIGENTEEMLGCDRQQVEEQLQVLKEAIAYCESVHDFVSRELLCELEEYEEGHLDWIDTQLDLIGKIGLENYQQSQL